MRARWGRPIDGSEVQRLGRVLTSPSLAKLVSGSRHMRGENKFALHPLDYGR
jgi:hypothetical protein